MILNKLCLLYVNPSIFTVVGAWAEDGQAECISTFELFWKMLKSREIQNAIELGNQNERNSFSFIHNLFWHKGESHI